MILDKKIKPKIVLYRIRNKSHLKSIVLPILDKYPMFSNKQYDYLMFKELPDYIRPIEPFNSIETILFLQINTRS